MVEAFGAMYARLNTPGHDQNEVVRAKGTDTGLTPTYTHKKNAGDSIRSFFQNLRGKTDVAAQKATDGAQSVKDSVAEELRATFGDRADGLANELFRGLGLTNKVKFGDLERINAEITSMTKDKTAIDDLKSSILDTANRYGGDPGNDGVALTVVRYEKRDGTFIFKLQKEGDNVTDRFLTGTLRSTPAETGARLAVETIGKAIDNDFGPGEGDRILAGLQIIDTITVGDLGRIMAQLRNEFAAEHSDEMTAAQTKVAQGDYSGNATGADKPDDNGIGDGKLPITSKNDIRIAADGSGGAMFVQSGDNPAIVLKAETSAQGEMVKILGRLAEVFDGGASFPTSLPAAEVLSEATVTDKTAFAAAKQVILDVVADELDAKPGDSKFESLEKRVKDPETSFLKFEMVGGKQLNRLDTFEKIALLSDPGFGQQIGRAAISSALMGLRDHLGVIGNANVANLFLDNNNVINFIDLDMMTVNVLKDPNKDPSTLVESDFEAKFGVETDRLMNDFEGLINTANAMATGDPKALNKSQLSQLVETFSGKTKGTDDFFAKSEGVAVEIFVTDDVKSEFAKNVVVGALDALSHLANNADSIADRFEKEFANDDNLVLTKSDIEGMKALGPKVEAAKAEFRKAVMASAF